MDNGLPPKWLLDRIDEWKNILGLSEWIIGTSIARVCSNNIDSQACCYQYPDLNKCCLEFRSDIEDNEEWNIIIIHELLHVKHARIDHYLEEIIFPKNTLCSSDSDTYSQYMESYIHGLATALYNSYPKNSATSTPKKVTR